MLPDKFSQTMWGEFGYEGSMCDRAIRGDNLEDLKECIERGFIEPTSDVMGARSVLDFCVKRKSEKCAAYLRKAGWPMDIRTSQAIRKAE